MEESGSVYNNENLVINNMNPNSQPIDDVEKADTSVSEEEEVGEHDIVIEEGFQINMDIAEISDSMAFNESSSEGESNQIKEEVSIGTEQSGNITF